MKPDYMTCISENDNLQYERNRIAEYDENARENEHLCEMNFAQHSLQKPIKIIATSGGAINALSKYCKQQKNITDNSADCVALYYGFVDSLIKDSDVPNNLIVKLDVMDLCRDMNDYTLLYPIFDDIIGDSTEWVLLLHTAGSVWAHKHKWPYLFAKYLQSKGINIVLLSTYPYLFEGQAKRDKANEMVDILSNYCVETIVVDAESLRLVSNITFFQAFSILDDALCEKINLILQKYCDDSKDAISLQS